MYRRWCGGDFRAGRIVGQSNNGLTLRTPRHYDAGSQEAEHPEEPRQTAVTKLETVMDISDLHPLEAKMLLAMEPEQEEHEDKIRKKAELSPEHMRSAAGWLLGRKMVEVAGEDAWEEISLTDTGAAYADRGMPESQILNAIREGGGLRVTDLPARTGLEQQVVGPAVGTLKKERAVEIGEGGILSVAPGEGAGKFAAADRLLARLAAEGTLRKSDLASEEAELASSMQRKRGKGKGVFRVDRRAKKIYSLTGEGAAARQQLAEAGVRGDEISTLTPEMLKSGSWKGKRFRKYNISLEPVRCLPGRLHPYGEFLDRTREKLISLGFKEMRGSLVENEFWNMDALFMPQFHSARDIHDVYYVADPPKSDPVEEPFLTRVGGMHENGGDTGSIGWRYRYDAERARNLVLRSQGTAVSARTMAEGPDIPGKYFSVARVFRYEQVSMKHLVDFMQVEGIVLGEGINFSTLIGLLKLFAVEVAKAEEIKFTPAYFPFTEPSVEMHVNHPTLGWVELGGAGIFRPEVRRPLGIEVPVIAWGLGIDRMAMNALGIDNIRNLFSPDLDMVRRTTLPFGI